MNSELTSGRAVPSTQGLEDDRSAMVHEELARLDFVLNKIAFRAKTVLDLGCGTGYGARYIESAAPREIVVSDRTAADSGECWRTSRGAHEFHSARIPQTVRRHRLLRAPR